MSTLSDEQEVAHLQVVRANDEKERLPFKRKIEFVKKTDDLGFAVYDILE